jgi:hypothetical protein
MSALDMRRLLWRDAADRLLAAETEKPPSPEVICPRCGKGLKRRGAHLHTRRCKG